MAYCCVCSEMMHLIVSRAVSCVWQRMLVHALGTCRMSVGSWPSTVLLLQTHASTRISKL